MLIKRGADINKRMDGAWTPLSSAVSAGQYGTVALLMCNGADKSSRTEAGWDMYRVAGDKERLREVVVGLMSWSSRSVIGFIGD